MARIARIVLPGVPYHATQRGNGRQQVFFEASDYRLYLDLLRHHARHAELGILAYCLMPNHAHLVVKPETSKSMPQALARTHAEYARHFNLNKQTCGHVWQSRYFSCPLDSTHLWRTIAYVERNPVRARMVDVAEQHPWSSASAHLRGHDPSGLLDMSAWDPNPQWIEDLRSSAGEEAFARRVQEASIRGRPLGDSFFVENLEARTGRTLHAKPTGRPKKRLDSEEEEPRQLSLEIGV